MSGAIPFIGMGIGALGALNQGQVQKNAYELESAAKKAQAAQVDISADREIELTKRRLEKTQGAQMVAFGRSGVQATTGSALEQMENTAAEAMDEMNAIRNAARYRKDSLLNEASISSYLGEEAENASYYNAAGGILSGISSNPYMYDSPVAAPKGGGNL
jgi:hypothetical protein